MRSNSNPLRARAYTLAIEFAYLGRKYYGMSELMDLCHKVLR